MEDRQTPIDQFLAHDDAFWDALGGRGRVKRADEVDDDHTVTMSRRRSLKIESRKSKLASMSRSESFKYLVKEKMEGASQILHNKWWTIWISSLTVYALFGDDIRFLATDKSADPWFYSVSIVALIFFIMEIFLNWLVFEVFINMFSFLYFTNLSSQIPFFYIEWFITGLVTQDGV